MKHFVAGHLYQVEFDRKLDVLRSKNRRNDDSSIPKSGDEGEQVQEVLDEVGSSDHGKRKLDDTEDSEDAQRARKKRRGDSDPVESASSAAKGGHINLFEAAEAENSKKEREYKKYLKEAGHNDKVRCVF